MIDVLTKLFGSSARVKILRLFLVNKDEQFNIAEIAKRTKVQKVVTKKEVDALEKIKLLNIVKRAKPKAWHVNNNFAQLRALELLILQPNESDAGFISQKLEATGNIKLITITGIFVPDATDSEIDLLIVGDKIGRRKMETAISDIEANFGKELRFALFTTSDFNYRMDIHDRLLRDVFDYPHEVIVDKLN